jgi:hypothetical protein
MNNYRNIAIIMFRITAISFIVSALLEVAIVMASIVLISLGIVPQDAIAHEAWMIQGVFFLIGGGILYSRSRSLAGYVCEALEPEKAESGKQSDST